MHPKLLLLCLLLAYNTIPETSAQDEHTEVIINLFATDLKGCDDLSACDAAVKIMCSTTLSDWKLCGEALEIKDDNFPVWPERFSFQYLQSEHMRWRFDIADKDLIVDDPIGSVLVVVEQFLNSTEVQRTMRYELSDNRGSFFVHRRQ